MKELLKHYKYDFGITLLAIAGVLWYYGVLSMFQLMILIVIEITFSFDNAVVNARILKDMSKFWQTLFMTVGILIAVVGMRVVFPIVIVMLSANMSAGDVWHLALFEPHQYAEKLEGAHSEIAIFGGAFLFMIFFTFIFEEREVHWLGKIERPLAKAGKLDMIAAGVTLLLVWLVATTAPKHEEAGIFAWGVAAVVLYVIVGSLDALFESDEDDGVEEGSTTFTLRRDASKPLKTGGAAFSAFMYLELQDAALSFDGVSGAFAVSDMIVLIAIGLGVGALFVRSMTVHLVRENTLSKYRYLEHGAHWAIGVLAACMILSIHFHIPEWITGLIGVVFISFAFRASVKHNKQARQQERDEAIEAHTAAGADKLKV